ncbi:4a-hydroxytetrahydrobiopterin dehydratase [Mycobacterium tuberculosis]|uniref:4a-hydroxytetrahydrobiopterin dehydratase n=1 Tax=Mycobacterium tuberculosis TaxID=1773 RepID=UPI003F81D13D
MSGGSSRRYPPELRERSVRLTCWTRQMHCLTRVDFDLAEAFSAVHDEQCSQQVAR